MFLFLAKNHSLPPKPPKNPQLQQVKVLHSYNILYILIYRLTARLGISCRTEMLIQTWLVTTLFACFFVPFYQKDRTTCIFAKKGTLRKGECTCILHRSFGYL